MLRYEQRMEMLKSAKDAKVGDKIKCQGITCTIGEIFYYDKFVEELDGVEKVFYDIEFRDTNGNYRSWKSIFDGGVLIPA